MRDIKIGLALGSGAARGLAHIGVLRALEEADVPIHLVSGTSIGAVIGGLYCSGLGLDRIGGFAAEFGDKRILYWLDPSFMRDGGLLKGERIEQSIIDFTGPLTFSGLKIPLYVVATDIITGAEVVISEGDLFKALRASYAIPGIFSPVLLGGRFLADGALITPVPTRVLKEAGCDLIIAVNVGSAITNKKTFSDDESPTIIDVLMQSLFVTQQAITEPLMRIADVCIIPDVGDFGWTEFSRTKELSEAGYVAAKKCIPSIKKRAAMKRRLTFFKRLF